MGTKAYLMVNLDKKFSHDGYYLDAVRELAAIPEVEFVERVSGICDLLVKVDAPIRVVFVANKILAKEWVKDLKMLRVEPFRIDEFEGLTYGELVRLRRVTPVEATQ